MDNWNEIRTASYVARLGTITAASNALGVHRATVTRHIDLLEERLGAKLFHRHGRGFTSTDLGKQLLSVADATNEQFSQLLRKAHGQDDALEGDLIVTSIVDLAHYVLPMVKAFNTIHPKVNVRFLGTDTLVKLEYGEAHIAIRSGAKPQELDNVVQPFITSNMALCASDSYVEQYGLPKNEHDYHLHRFVGAETVSPRAPHLKWINENIPKDAIKFKSNQNTILVQAVLAGIGIGILPAETLDNNGRALNVVDVNFSWGSQSWIVTHVDLHRSHKVQAFLNVIKDLQK
ncbi:MAG: LysR family transcriptional regulator [Rhizobiales bacterium]|nr:LysR family transcriptional regulator [Hyphomicrobiales bacterium]